MSVRNGPWCDNYRADHTVYLQMSTVTSYVYTVIFEYISPQISLMFWKDNVSVSWIYRADRFSLLGVKPHSSSHRLLHTFIEAPLWERHKNRLLWVEGAWQEAGYGSAWPLPITPPALGAEQFEAQMSHMESRHVTDEFPCWLGYF